MKANPCVSVSLLFGCIFITFTAPAFCADAGGGKVNTSTNSLGDNMTKTAGPADQKTMLREGFDRKTDNSSKGASGATSSKGFRLLDGALLGVGASNESFQWPDREPTGYTDFPSSRSWAAGPDATRQPQGLRIFKWSWK